jgi:hypothetical protein
MNNFPSPAELDTQTKIKVNRWIEVGSEEWRMLDETPEFTKKIIALGFKEPAYLFTDANGRIWGKGEDGFFYPFHFKQGSTVIGYRLTKRAVN